LLQAEEKAAAEKAELDAARKKVMTLEKALAEAKQKGNAEDEESLIRELEKARHTEKAERADYQAAEERRAKEQMEAENARDALDQQTAAANTAEEAYARKVEEASIAAKAAQAASAAAEYATEIPSVIGSTESGNVQDPEQEDNIARLRAEQGQMLVDSAEGQITRDQRTQRAGIQRTTNDPKESIFSRAARRNEDEAARGTDWERTKTAEGKRKWRQKQAMLAGTWSRGPGTRLNRGLYCADRLDPRSPTPSIVREQEQKMASRAVRSREYQRRRKAIATTYPTLATPLEPNMKAWGRRAPPSFYPPPAKPRIEGKLLKWRPAVLEHSEVADAWRTRWVEFRVEAEAHPPFETLAEEQQYLVTEVEEDLRSRGKSQAEIKNILQSIKYPLRERRAPDKDVEELLFSAKAEDRRKRRRLRPVLSYCHSRGGRQLGSLDLRGAVLTRSYRPDQGQQAGSTRPLMPSDLLRSNVDKICASNSRRRLQKLVGEGPRAQLLEDLCRDCIKAGWEPGKLHEAYSFSESTAPPWADASRADAACGRPYLTVTAKDPHGGHPYVLAPVPTWEPHVKQLCEEVGGSSRLDAVLALMETHGNPRLAKARLGDPSQPPRLEDVKTLLRTSIVFTTTSVTFSCDKAAAAAEEYLQNWFEQFRYAVWETDLSTDRSQWVPENHVEQQPPPQAGPRSFDPPGGPQDGPVHKTPGHPAYYQPPPASLYAVRGKLRHELEVAAQRFVPFRGGLYRNMTDEMETAAATRAAMQWRSGGKATNGGVRWAPVLDDRKAAVMKAFANVTEGTAAGKSVGEVAAEAA
jgi:hypothetical protein